MFITETVLTFDGHGDGDFTCKQTLRNDKQNWEDLSSQLLYAILFAVIKP